RPCAARLPSSLRSFEISAWPRPYGRSGVFPTAWPPEEKATARKSQARQSCCRDGTGDPAHAATRDSVVETVGAPCHNGWDRAYYHPTAQEEAMMAFTAMLSELYGALRRKVGADEPTKAAAEAVVIENTRFRSIDGRFDALSHTMDQRFEALSQRFDG